ncbi:MAG: hypothetical protein QOH69_1940 [Actinomycetota bacterium]|jgi:hypothetical protein|nr:hypothetical protein [Actinomycetota bacterium]
MRFRFRADAGAVTAEFAAAMPAVVLVLACALGAIGLGGEQLRLQGAAFDAARLLGRGDPGALAIVRSVSPVATLTTRTSGVTICADASAVVSLGVLSGIALHATSCALDDAGS